MHKLINNTSLFLNTWHLAVRFSCPPSHFITSTVFSTSNQAGHLLSLVNDTSIATENRFQIQRKKQKLNISLTVLGDNISCEYCPPQSCWDHSMFPLFYLQFLLGHKASVSRPVNCSWATWCSPGETRKCIVVRVDNYDASHYCVCCNTGMYYDITVFSFPTFDIYAYQARFAMTSTSTWTNIDGRFSYSDFYWRIVGLFEDEEEAAGLIKFYNQYVPFS